MITIIRERERDGEYVMVDPSAISEDLTRLGRGVEKMWQKIVSGRPHRGLGWVLKKEGSTLCMRGEGIPCRGIQHKLKPELPSPAWDVTGGEPGRKTERKSRGIVCI